MGHMESYAQGRMDAEEESEHDAQHNPEYQCKHWVIPMELVVEYEVLHTITAAEFILLSRIESLIRYGADNCCYATNEWFAKRHGCNVRNIQYMLNSLKRKEFINTKIMKGGVRKITTIWTPKRYLKTQVSLPKRKRKRRK